MPMKMKHAVLLSAILPVVMALSGEGLCRSRFGGVSKIMETIVADYEEKQRVSVGETRDIVLYRKTIDYDDYYKLAVQEGENVLLEYGGDAMNHIMLQTTDNLLEDRYFLFEEGINDRYEGGALYTASSHIGALDLQELKVAGNFIKDAEEFEGGNLSIDVDPSGRYVLLPYVGEEPDFQYIRVYDGKERVFYEIDTDELMGYHLEKVRWKDSINAIEFLNPADGKIMSAAVDWNAKKIVQIEALK